MARKENVPAGPFFFLAFYLCLVPLTFAGEISVTSAVPSTPSLVGRQIDNREVRLIQEHLLVILPNTVSSKTYSTYLADLSDSGFNIDIHYTNSIQKSVFENHANLKYGGIIFIDHGANVRWLMDQLIQSIDDGDNVLIITEGPQVGVLTNRIAMACGIEFESSDSYVLDYLPSTGVDTTILNFEYTAVAPLTSTSGNLAYRGFSQFVNMKQSLIFSILKTQPYHYLRVEDDNIRTLGMQSSLVSAMIARNGARVVFSGSSEMFSDSFFSSKTINRDWVAEVTDWCFQRRGVISYSNLKHYKVGESVSPSMYRMKDEVVFSIDLHELKNGYWEPYQTNDVQLEMVMLDPYIRLFLDPPSSPLSPTFGKQFKTPDQYGVFKFVVKYNRFGYNPIYVESLAPLRNYKHDDYDRFLFTAFPYYGSTLICLLGTMVFSILFLFSAERKVATTTK